MIDLFRRFTCFFGSDLEMDLDWVTSPTSVLPQTQIWQRIKEDALPGPTDERDYFFLRSKVDAEHSVGSGMVRTVGRTSPGFGGTRYLEHLQKAPPDVRGCPSDPSRSRSPGWDLRAGCRACSAHADYRVPPRAPARSRSSIPRSMRAPGRRHTTSSKTTHLVPCHRPRAWT
jgi:hypothetical protein